MNKITTLAAVLLISTVVGAPAALAQTTTAPNSGAGLPGLPGNKSGPPVRPGDQFNIRPDQSNVPGHHGWFQGRGAMNPTVMRMIFSLMDADGDGKLTLQEWQAAHERIFKAMDTDHDGTVTFEEMQAFVRGH